VRVLTGHTARVNACRFSSDGRQLISVSHDRTLRIWSAAMPTKMMTILEGHALPVLGFAELPAAAGRLIVTCSEDGTVRTWDA